MDKKFNILISILNLSFLSSCLNMAGDCETEILEETCNESMTLAIVKTSTDCGATTTPSMSIRLSIGCSNLDVPEKENIIYASEYHYDYQWIDDNKIAVKTKDTTGNDFRKEKLQLDGMERPVIVVFD